MLVVYISILFIIGLLLGHVYTKLGYTLGKKESITKINPGCDSCGHHLKLYERLYLFRELKDK